MIKNDILYKFCKKYTDKFEEAEKEAIARIEELIDKGYSEEETKEIIFEGDEMDIIFNSVEVPKAGLQALIVDDFVNELPSDLQTEVMMYCMESMM